MGCWNGIFNLFSILCVLVIISGGWYKNQQHQVNGSPASSYDAVKRLKGNVKLNYLRLLLSKLFIHEKKLANMDKKVQIQSPTVAATQHHETAQHHEATQHHETAQHQHHETTQHNEATQHHEITQHHETTQHHDTTQYQEITQHHETAQHHEATQHQNLRQLSTRTMRQLSTSTMRQLSTMKQLSTRR
ncbi:G-box-binding factor-like [Gigantopelta aegis]|uniref:G-box-binding factor-like n=1 Tax=Gigantopelta aegis TaxID=1735272 RepID=UPI001B887A6A|nr:G-box-binding factor-like [Gigantopelta aegis]